MDEKHPTPKLEFRLEKGFEWNGWIVGLSLPSVLVMNLCELMIL